MFNDPLIFLDSTSQTESIYVSNILNEDRRISEELRAEQKVNEATFSRKKG